MRAISPIIEHLVLSAGALVIFVLVILMFTSIQDQLLTDDINNRLNNLSNQVALKIVQAYKTGKTIPEISPELPVVRFYLDIPSTVSGYAYVVSSSDGKVVASSKGAYASVGLLGIDRDFTIQGKLVGSPSRRPAITYYKSQNLVVLENIG